MQAVSVTLYQLCFVLKLGVLIGVLLEKRNFLSATPQKWATGRLPMAATDIVDLDQQSGASTIHDVASDTDPCHSHGEDVVLLDEPSPMQLDSSDVEACAEQAPDSEFLAADAASQGQPQQAPPTLPCWLQLWPDVRRLVHCTATHAAASHWPVLQQHILRATGIPEPPPVPVATRCQLAFLGFRCAFARRMS